MLIITEILNLIDVRLLVEFGDRKEISADIDMLIVSEDFHGISMLKKRELIQRIDRSIDPICLTTKQFKQLKESNSSLYNCIKKTHLTFYGDKTTFC
jgi:hypothetical protein